MEDGTVSGNSLRDDQEGATLPSDTKIGVFCSSDIQVAINEGNRQGHTFFVVKVGKTGVVTPFQQVIPSDFSKYHPKLHLEDITLEGPCGRSWGVTIRPFNNVSRFGKGWRQFSVENHLREGYHLLFRLVGKSRFVVQFYDNLGQAHASFPPLTPMPGFDEPSLRDEEDASGPPPFQTPIDNPPFPLETPVAKPPPDPFETPIAETPMAKPPTKPKTPTAEPLPMSYNTAKVVLRHFFTHVHPNLSTDVPNSRAAIPAEDMTQHEVRNGIGGSITEHGGSYQGSYEERATEDGKAYIFIDSDDDDEPEQQALPELSIRTPTKRDFFERVDHKGTRDSYLGERAGFHSPEQVRTPRNERVECVEQDHFQGDHFPNTYSENTPVKRKRPARKRPASREGQGGHDPAYHGYRGTIRDLYKEPTTARHGHPRGYHKLEVRDTTTRGDFAQRASDAESYSMGVLSPAKILLAQQGCMNYSDIIAKRRRGYVTDDARQRLLTAATRCAAGLKNESFLVVMNEYHVYHEFQLAIPRDFLEATGTLKANKVKVCLIDSRKTSYETKWKWHSSCQTPFMNRDGWALFALDHTLEEGDVCVFESLGPGPAFLLSVHIFTVVENLARDNSTRELRSGPSAPLNQKFGRQAPAANNADQELRHKTRPVIDLGRPSLQKTIQKPYNLQAWTRLFKPRVKAHFGGNRDQRQ